MRLRNTGDSATPSRGGPRQRAERRVHGTRRHRHVLRRPRWRHRPPHRRQVGLHDARADDEHAPLRRAITVAKLVTGPVDPPPGPWRILDRGRQRLLRPRAWSTRRRQPSRCPAATRRGRSPSARSPAGSLRDLRDRPARRLARSTKPRHHPRRPERARHGRTCSPFRRDAAARPARPAGRRPQPPLPPGPLPLPGPDLVLAASVTGGADLAVTETDLAAGDRGRRRGVGTTRVRNNGPQPAVARSRARSRRSIPSHPNQVARILGVKAGPARPGCTSTRPVSCGGATLPVGAEVVIRVRARMLVPGSSRASSSRPRARRTRTPPTTSPSTASWSRAGQRRRGRARARVAGVGEPVAYRVVARGTGSDGARSVRFCHRPPARLLMTSAPGTFRYRGRVCRDVSAWRAGSAPPSPSTRSRRRAPAGARCALRRRPPRPTRGRRGADRIAVVAQTFAGTG